MQAVTTMQGKTALQRISQITLPITDPHWCTLCIRQIQKLCEFTFSGTKVRKSFSLQNTASYVQQQKLKNTVPLKLNYLRRQIRKVNGQLFFSLLEAQLL